MKNRRSELRWLLALWVSVAAPARAEEAAVEHPSAADDDRVLQAREAFRLGSALAKQAQWPEALAAFERSSKLHSHPATTYNMGFCERALGHVTRARKLLAQALTENERGAKTELPRDTRALAESYLAEMNSRVAHAIVTVRGSGVTLTIDGRPLENEPGAGRPLRVAGTREPGPAEVVDPGSFELLADAGSRVVVVTQNGVTRVLHWELGAAETRAFELGDAARKATREHERRPDRTWAVLAFGVGAAGALVGATSGITALHEKSGLDERCTRGSDRCDPRYQGDIDSMNRAATMSTIGFGIGALGIGAGVYLWLAGSADGRGTRARVGPRSVALETRF